MESTRPTKGGRIPRVSHPEVNPGESFIREEPATGTEAGAIVCLWPVRRADATASQCMKLMESARALAFWKNKGEDIYSPEDGDPL